MIVTGGTVPRIVQTINPQLDRGPNDRVLSSCVDNRTADATRARRRRGGNLNIQTSLAVCRVGIAGNKRVIPSGVAKVYLTCGRGLGGGRSVSSELDLEDRSIIFRSQRRCQHGYEKLSVFRCLQRVICPNCIWNTI